MQDKYVGDVGDFGKYALLKYMRKTSGLSLGVIWYLVNPDHTDGEHQVKDGKHIGYLGLKVSEDDQISQVKASRDGLKLEKCDSDLYEQLRTIFLKGERSLQAIENRVLGEGVSFFNDCVSNPKTAWSSERKKAREDWLRKALKKVKNQEIVFLDPDNGLASEDKDGSKAIDAKYVLRSELDKFWEGGTRIIVLYHHPNRKDKDVSHDEQIANLAAQIKNRPAFSNAAVFPLRYRRGTSRVYFVIVPQQDAEKWADCLHEFVTPWPSNKKTGKAFECKFTDKH